MLKLVNRTRSQGSRFTFCTDLRDVASRIPLACPPIILSFSLSLSLSLYPPRSLSLVSSLQPRLFRGEPSTPDSVAPTMEGSHCLRGLSLPSIAKYTPASPPVVPPVPCRFYSLSLSLFRFLVLPPPTSGVGRAVAFAALRLRFPYGTYLRLSCVLVIVLLRAWTAATRSESSAFSTLPPFFCRSSVPARRS